MSVSVKSGCKHGTHDRVPFFPRPRGLTSLCPPPPPLLF